MERKVKEGTTLDHRPTGIFHEKGFLLEGGSTVEGNGMTLSSFPFYPFLQRKRERVMKGEGKGQGMVKEKDIAAESLSLFLVQPLCQL